MKKISLILVLFSAGLLSAQADYSFTSSGEYFNKAYEYLGMKDYPEAFKYFNKIDKSDTLYDLAQFNKLIAQYTAKYYKDVLETASKLINEESSYAHEVCFYKIKALIEESLDFFLTK